MSIEDKLQQAANSGRPLNLTIWYTPDGRYQCSLSQDRVGWKIETDADLLTALNRVLGDDQPKGAFE